MSFIIAIVGGSGSGKTTLTRELRKRFPSSSTLLVDMYYKDNSALPLEERAKLNYDDPERFDAELFSKHLKNLKDGKAVNAPVYDFSIHNRTEETTRIEPADVIIVDGIMSMWLAKREAFDYTIYVNADADTRLGRRLLRDIRERGRTPESVIKQYIATVKPMHNRYVESCKYNVDFVFDNEKDGRPDADTVDLLVKKIQGRMNESK